MRLWIDGQPHPVRNQVTVLGRDPTVDIAVLGAEVSRKHAFVVALGDDRHLLIDFKSANGTRLNGRRIETALLRDGDQVDLAGSVLTVETGQRRAGSLAATGSYKTLLRLEEAQGEEGDPDLPEIWNRHVDELSPMLPALGQARRSEDLKSACRAALEVALRAMGSDRGLLLTLDETAEHLRVAAEQGYPEGRGLRRNLHQALVDEAFDNDRIVTTRDTFVSQVFGSIVRQPAALPDVASAMAAPLAMCGTPLGVVYVERRGGTQVFEAGSRHVMRFVASMLGPLVAAHLLERHLATRLGEIRIVGVELAAEGPGFCEVCGENLAESRLELVRCNQCRIPLHLDCWNFVGGCAIFGCGSHEATPIRR